MANGRAASLEPHDPLAGEAYLAIGEIIGRAAAARVVAAAPLTLGAIEAVAGAEIETREETAFDRASASLRARRRRKLGALTLAEGALSPPADERSAAALARGILDLGLARLPWTKALAQWRGRVGFLRRAEGESWPDLGDAALAASPDWLAPFLLGKTRLDEFSGDELGQALRALLPYDLARRLEAEAPSHYVAPTGTAAPVDYESEGGPSVALQGAGAVRAFRPSRARRRPRAVDVASAVARASADPDHPRPAGLLERLVGGRARRATRPLSPPFLARRPGERSADQPGQAEGDVRGEHGAARLAGRIWG